MSNANRDMEDYRSTLERYYEKGLNDGRNEVWNFLKVFCGMDVGERQKVFGEYAGWKLIENMSPQEALAKLEAYEKSKEIKVGDVIESIYSGRLGVITNIQGIGKYVLFTDGSAGALAHDDIRKTGKHIDINSVLEQLRGDKYDRE